jgi:hypothetical protein
MLEELYDEFRKYSRAEVLHFCKLGQQRKTTSENESSRPFKYNKTKKVHKVSMQHISKFIASIQTDVDLQRIGRKFLDLCDKKPRAEHMTPGEIIIKLEVTTPTEAEAGAEVKKNLSIVCSMKKTLIIRQGIALFSWNPKRR